MAHIKYTKNSSADKEHCNLGQCLSNSYYIDQNCNNIHPPRYETWQNNRQDTISPCAILLKHFAVNPIKMWFIGLPPKYEPQNVSIIYANVSQINNVAILADCARGLFNNFAMQSIYLRVTSIFNLYLFKIIVFSIIPT